MKSKDRDELKLLFKDLKNNNTEIIEKLYSKYSKIVHGVAFSMLKNRDDAEDVVQIVFSKLFTLDKDKLPKDNEPSWLYSVTKNETLLILRNKKCDINLEDIYYVENANNEIEKIMNIDAYNRLISKLNNKEKEIISMKIVSNLTFQEISELLGEPIETIKWRYYESMYSLRIMLSNLGIFIVTFALGIFTFKKFSKTVKKEISNEIVEDNKDTSENLRKDEIKKDEAEYIETDDIETKNQTQENTIVGEPIISHDVNYLGYGIMGISTIFLILVIIFSIFLAKHQLNAKKKSSNY